MATQSQIRLIPWGTKLPPDLPSKVKAAAAIARKPISEFVREALEAALKRKGSRRG